MVKRCNKCKRLLDESQFHKETRRKDGIRSVCKECAKNYRIDYHKQRTKLRFKEKDAINILGGYKIFILNYASLKEKKYNIISTAGKIFRTNNKQEFIQYLEGI